jgi:hypothetical protein
MRIIQNAILLLLLFISVGCEDTAVFTYPEKNQDKDREGQMQGDSGESDQVGLPYNLTLSASRDYYPSEFNDDSKILQSSAVVSIPRIIHTTYGNAGNGWVSLTIGNKRACYQGNAKEAGGHSDTFTLKRFSRARHRHCRAANRVSPSPGQEVTASSGDQVVLSVTGSNCKNRSVCRYVEIDVEIEVREIDDD